MAKDVAIRLGFFHGIFALVAAWKPFASRGSLKTSNVEGWLSTLGITFLNSMAVRLEFLVMPVGMVMLVQRNGWSLMNNFHLPYWLSVAVGVFMLDLVICLQQSGFIRFRSSGICT